MEKENQELSFPYSSGKMAVKTVLQSLYYVSWQPQLRTGGFC